MGSPTASIRSGRVWKGMQISASVAAAASSINRSVTFGVCFIAEIPAVDKVQKMTSAVASSSCVAAAWSISCREHTTFSIRSSISDEDGASSGSQELCSKRPIKQSRYCGVSDSLYSDGIPFRSFFRTPRSLDKIDFTFCSERMSSSIAVKVLDTVFNQV